MNRLLLILLAIVYAHTQTTILAGSYTPIANLKDASLLNVSMGVSTYIPAASTWTLVAAQRQLVNGFNYLLVYQVNQTTKANVTAYTAFDGTISPNSVAATYFPSPSTITNNTQQNSTLYGGYVPVANLQDPAFVIVTKNLI
jgi:hypothetical protein